MKKTLLLLSLSLLMACSNVPISNRKQISLIPNSTIMVESEKGYAEVLQKSKVLSDSRAKEIKEIGSKIIHKIRKYIFLLNVIKFDNLKIFLFNFILSIINLININISVIIT